MAKQPNYTEEALETVLRMYEESEQDNSKLKEIGEAVGKTDKSVRAKLVKEGAYVTQDKPTSRTKDEGPTKKDLINELVTVTGLTLEGIDGANKPALQELVTFLMSRDNDEVVEAVE